MRDDVIKESGGYKVTIEPDENPVSPRDWDNMSKMICFHRRHALGDEHDYKSSDYDGWEELEAAIVKKERPAAI